jgi:hypothetical protein
MAWRAANILSAILAQSLLSIALENKGKKGMVHLYNASIEKNHHETSQRLQRSISIDSEVFLYQQVTKYTKNLHTYSFCLRIEAVSWNLIKANWSIFSSLPDWFLKG